ncbi:TOM (translocase of outer membrane) complex component [Phlyctochytrium planicorne]|nr:TOM (translocase of outer membrane) complex component [Phlyctochytrium planicorne]
MSELVKKASFWENHWRSIVVVASVAGIVGGVAYLVTSNKGGKKKADGKKGRKNVETAKTGTSEPSKAAKAAESDVNSPAVSKSGNAEDAHAELFAADADALSTEAREELSQKAKVVGNRLFGEKKYEEAIRFYTRAISLKEDSVYYANRGACFANLGRHNEVIDDCTAALRLDTKYIKAIYRRAQAYTSLNDYEKALLDYTAICMLEEFKKESSIATTDRILKEIGKKKADEVLKTKVPSLPSDTFVTAYMDSFRDTKGMARKVAELKSDIDADKTVANAYALILQAQWQKSMEVVSSFDFAALSEAYKSFAYNLAGTFAFLRGEIEKAEEYLNLALKHNEKDVNAIIKKSSICMEKGDVEGALANYEKAQKVDTSNADIYYHRGQVLFLTGDLQSAIADYNKSLKLDSNFVYAHIQLGVALYKTNDQSHATVTFEKAKKKFPTSPEIYNYYGELLIDQQSFEEALKSFEKSIELNPKSPLPYINKAILYLQWKKDTVKSEELFRKAIEVDPLCDIAYMQLAQQLIQKTDFTRAIECYDDAIGVSRTEAELINAICCREAAIAQKHTAALYPEVYAKLAMMG